MKFLSTTFVLIFCLMSSLTTGMYMYIPKQRSDQALELVGWAKLFQEMQENGKADIEKEKSSNTQNHQHRCPCDSAPASDSSACDCEIDLVNETYADLPLQRD